MKKVIVLTLLFLLIIAASVQAITAQQIIKKVDQNIFYDTTQSTATMKIKIGKTVREKTMVSYSKGDKDAFVEFLSPARDRGVRYLKLGQNMWMYLPSVEKTIKIAGHMLRQSMMGSDFSYEDALENDDLFSRYSATLIGEEKYDNRTCYVLDLIAKVKDVTYYHRKLWVDKTRFIVLKSELYAQSGKLLKTSEVKDVYLAKGKYYYPTHVIMRDHLREDTSTEFLITKIRFDINIPSRVFSKNNLSRRD